jgi:hypothetical protein
LHKARVRRGVVTPFISDDELVCLTVYRKGAREVVRRLAAWETKEEHTAVAGGNHLRLLRYLFRGLTCCSVDGVLATPELARASSMLYT